MLLYIVRHGDPNYVDDCLTEKGILQAEAVGKRIAASGINQIYSSPMGRAKQTAEPACRLLGLEYEIEDWTREIETAIKTTYPEHKGSRGIIEEHVYMKSVRMSVMGEYENVYILPEMTRIDSKTENGRTHFETGDILGYRAFLLN